MTIRQPWTISRLAGLLLLFSAIDAACTHFGLFYNLIEELNPWALYLYEKHEAGFYAWKLLLPLAMLAICPLLSESSRVKTWVAGATCLYAAVCVYHLVWIAWWANLPGIVLRMIPG